MIQKELELCKMCLPRVSHIVADTRHFLHIALLKQTVENTDVSLRDARVKRFISQLTVS